MNRSPLIAIYLLAGIFLFVPSTIAQGSRETETVPSESDSRSRARDRLLHLAGGGVLRAESARLDEETWHYRSQGEKKSLPAHLVVANALEKDVLRESQKRLSQARREGLAERAAVAVWMAEQGLLTEAFEEADELLEEDPDQPEIRDLLSTLSQRIALPPLGDPSLEIPQRIDALVAFASLAPPSLQEMSIDRLRSVASEPSLHPQLRKLLDEPNDGARTFATLALRRIFPARTEEDLARQLLNHALFDRSEAVRQGASLALRDAGQPGLLVNLVAVLDSPSSSLRTRAVEALGHFGRPASPTVKALVNHLDTLGSRSSSGPRATASFGTQRAFVQGFNSAIAQGSAIGNPDIGVLQTGATIDIRVHGVSSSPATLAAKEAKAIRHSLERITGEKPGTTSSAWIKWWKNRETDR